MLIEIRTDNQTEGHERFVAYANGVVDDALSRFKARITRVEVHLSDINGHKGGPDDTKCVMEARLDGRPPVAVTHHAGGLEQAVDGAAGKLKRLVESTLSRESSLAGHRDR